MRIESYLVRVYGKGRGIQAGRAQVRLFDELERLAGILIFLEPELILPNIPTDSINEEGVIKMYLDWSMFQGILEILRTERPLFLFFRNNKGILATGREPVGEEEELLETIAGK